jgi:aryl carrier-like protein
MVRTGDVARRLRGGVLEYLHRADSQVKIRGHRVEPGEIEAALKAHPDVRDAAVIARQDARGDLRLVAYVVTADGATATASALFAWLAERVPPALMPAAFVPMPALPRSPHGKVDAGALPAPEGERPALAAAYAPPASALEARIAALWQEALSVARVGVHDNFFELGGNSLLIAQVHRRLRDELGADLRLVEMFRHPTVSALARRLGGAPDAEAAARRIKDEGERRRAALSRRREAAQGRPRRPAR